MARDVVFEKQKPVAKTTARHNGNSLPSLPVKSVGIIPCYFSKLPNSRPRGIPGQVVKTWDKEKKQYVRATIKSFMHQYGQWVYYVIIDGREDGVWTNNLL